MDDDSYYQLKEELIKTDEQLHETHHLIHELHLSYGLGVAILASLVAVALQTFSYLLYGSIITQQGVLLFIFCLLVGPASFFLILLHVYELYGIMKKGEKSIPLSLDLMFFMYSVLAFTTMVGLSRYYQNHSISWQFMTAGWGAAVALLSVEVFLALFLAQFIVTIFIAPSLPHFFTHGTTRHTSQKLSERKYRKPVGMYYFRKKPDFSRWQDQECFVKY